MPVAHYRDLDASRWTQGVWLPNPLVVTYDPSIGPNEMDHILIYVDGVLITSTYQGGGTGTYSWSSSQAPYVGPFASFAYKGPFESENLSVWNVALTAGQVTSLYNGGTPGDLSLLGFFSNCTNWWRLGDGVSDTHLILHDSVGGKDLSGFSSPVAGNISTDHP